MSDAHPWSEFLKARMKAMKWMIDEFGRNDKEIANVLSMDEEQVYSIRTCNQEVFGDEDE